MRDRAVLPVFNNAVPMGSGMSPMVGSNFVVDSPGGGGGGGGGSGSAVMQMHMNGYQQHGDNNSAGAVSAAPSDAVLLDIETGPVVAAAPTGRRWFRSDSFSSKTAVFSSLGSVVSSFSSRCRGALLGSSIVTYIHRVPALDKPFDLTEIHPGDPKEGML